MVEVGIAAVHHAAHSACFQMTQHRLVGGRIERQIGMARQRLHGNDGALQVIRGNRGGFHEHGSCKIYGCICVGVKFFKSILG
ncbi:Uncharacterised protein [Bordetella pertussis]|nr:Uncharacterised protein [Bordetella pertussis]